MCAHAYDRRDKGGSTRLRRLSPLCDRWHRDRWCWNLSTACNNLLHVCNVWVWCVLRGDECACMERVVAVNVTVAACNLLRRNLFESKVALQMLLLLLLLPSATILLLLRGRVSHRRCYLCLGLVTNKKAKKTLNTARRSANSTLLSCIFRTERIGRPSLVSTY